MAKTQILEYTINLDDKDVADRLIAALASGTPTAETGGLIVYPGGTKVGILRAPDGAAIEFANLVGAVPFGIIEVGQPIPPHDGGYLTSSWFSPSNTFPRNVATFQRSSGWWIFGSNTRFYWAAQVAWAPPAPSPTPATATEEPTEPADIPVRYALISGHGMPSVAGYGTTTHETQASMSIDVARVASRLWGGYDWCLYSDGGSAQEIRFNHVTDNVRRWERFYMNVPSAPNIQTGIWRIEAGSTSGIGVGLAVTPTMQLAFLNQTGVSSFALIGTVLDIEAERTYKVDVISYANSAADSLHFEVFINGTSVGTHSRSAGGGVQANRVLLNSRLGTDNSFTTGNTNALIRLSSWVLAAIPVTRDPSVAAWDVGTGYTTGQFVTHGGSTYRALQNSTGEQPGVADPPGSTTFPWWRKLVDPVDFQQGSHLAYVPPTAFSANHGTWTGDVRTLMQRGDLTPRSSITSSTSAALVACETNLARDVFNIPGVLGWVAAQIYSYDSRGANSGQLGYLLGSASAAVETNITQSISLAWHSIIYSPSGLTEPIDDTETIEIRHRKGTGADAAALASLFAIVEVIGRFGPEDNPVSESSGASSGGASTTAESPADDWYPNGLHNAQYPASPWHNDRGALGPIVVVGGTYVGNALGQTLSFPVPPVFLWIRRTASGSGVCPWWPTMLDGHARRAQGTPTTGITRLDQDTDFVDSDPDADQQMSFDVFIGGNDTGFNANGATYQYIAFCDPAARFTRAGAFIGNDLLAPFVHPFDDAEFLPEILFAYQEQRSTTSTITLHMQGPGHAAGTVQVLDSSTSIASALTVATGQMTVGANWVNAAFHHYSYLGFRRSDGNDHPDENKVMFLGTYTGDGAASRTINPPNAPGDVRPLFCVVQPANAASIYRDPSHTTNTSHAITDGSTTATGITAGSLGGFTVGTTLNSNGVVYNYFGFWADGTSGNGGWGTNGEYTPVPSDSPFPSDWTEPVEVPFEGASSSGPVGPPPEQPDLDETTALPNTTLFCLDYSQRICNRALGRIGVSKQIADLATDQTEQAVVARLHLKDDVEATLRLFPWAFATAYAELTLHSGDDSNPVNADWQYAYEAPVDLVFARRIAPQSGHRRKYDRDPIVFRLGLDQTDGHLLYCNERATADVPLVLEYTRRVGCPSYFGDALFRDALTWKIASSFAAALSKDATKAEFCLRAWEAFRGKAETAAANEQQAEKDTTGGDAPWTAGRGDGAPWTEGR